MHTFAPEMVLGKEVVDARGDMLGAVVDVGVHDLRRVKFLLVDDGAPDAARQLRRLGVELIDRVGARVVLKDA